MDGINLFTKFVAQHKPQLESSGIPQHFWQSLQRKLAKETFDAGISLQLLLIDYDGDEENGQASVDVTDTFAVTVAEEPRPTFALSVASTSGMKANDPNAIFLIDHAWTFRMNIARQQLTRYEQLTDRMCAIMGIDIEDDDRVDKVLRKMWRYCHSYTISTNSLSDEDRQPIWYVMDEVGSAITHSDEPNFRVVPFLYLNTQTTYSLLFPIQDCAHEEQVTRDFVEYVSKDAVERDALLLPWRTTDFRDYSYIQVEPEAEYFSSGHIAESVPEGVYATITPQLSRNQPLKVYSEYDVLSTHLTDPCFQLVASAEDADVLWLTHHYKNFAELAQSTPNKFINQFPYEYVLTIKDLLAITGRRAAKEHHDSQTLDTYPEWLPTTFNLKTELLQFASYYQHRTAKGLDNHWIVKPWNLARGLDTHISDSIVQIVRLPVTGPKIAQKYIERPVLFKRTDLGAEVKFDIRFVILVKSFKPLEAYVHRKFFLRFANKPFSLNHYDDYEQHFTVMNYHEEAQLRHITCEDFMTFWKEQYPTHEWTLIEKDICKMLYGLLTCATKLPPPCGIPPCKQSRALYAADIMLQWENKLTKGSNLTHMQPKLLEINWTPDCKRASRTHSINFITEEFLGGYMQDGRMSVVRRFFCLFVTFDLFFVSLLWLICIVINGDNIFQAFHKEIVNYTFGTSLFDVVGAAICRFIILIFFYAVLYMNHWIIIALSTSGSCFFLISKVFVYDWVDSHQQVFEVILIITSFVLAWGEAWFLDCRVIPQERHARSYFSAITTPEQRSPMMAPFLASQSQSNMPESIFYSPLETVHNSDDDDDEQDEEYHQMALDCVRRAYELFESSDWKVEKVTSKGDQIRSTQRDKLGKIYRLTAHIKYPPKALLEELFYKIESIPKWNPTLLESKIIHKINSYTDITYQATVGGGGGMVKSRDFINLRCWRVFRNGKICEESDSGEEATDSGSDIAGPGSVSTISDTDSVATTQPSSVESNRAKFSSSTSSAMLGTGDVENQSGSVNSGRVGRAFKTLSKSLGAKDFNTIVRIDPDEPPPLDEETFEDAHDNIDDLAQLVHKEARVGMQQSQNVNVDANDDASSSRVIGGNSGKSKVYLSAAISIEYAPVPPTSKYIRGENIVAGFALHEIEGKSDVCIFDWILCLDLKGYIPRYVLDAAYTTFMSDYMKYLRKYIKELRTKRKRVSRK
ncbi:uncharacterized protein [Eurosta solidaginis]|uniref:uncharacterized protein isoform X1 n=2 Tax=Eurosta solidaginis TaxID=178769 RepID=UPI00353056AB